MGYYSEVALCFTKKGHEQFLAELAKQSNVIKEDFAETINAEPTEINESTLYFWNSIKWYDNFPSIEFIMNFLELVNDITADDYLFFRIGTDSTDIITMGKYYSNPFGLAIESKISMDSFTP